jgi:GNAT superfamily N-acetyltransferase
MNFPVQAMSMAATRNPTFQWEPFARIAQEAMPVLRAYWDESQIFGRELPMDPDFDAFFQLERAGRFRVYTCRRQGRLIGVNSFMVGGTLLRREPPTAAGFILVLSPAERRGWTGYKLVKGAEDAFREWGVRLVIYTPSSTTDLGPILRRLGYREQGATYEKLL